jgi:hypothetical protein
MKCPYCGGAASTLFRNTFSLQQVPADESFSGYLRCRQCGKRLRNRNYANLYRFAPLAFAATFLPTAFLSDSVAARFGETGLVSLWTIIITVVIALYVYGMWRTAVLERADDPADERDHSLQRWSR